MMIKHTQQGKPSIQGKLSRLTNGIMIPLCVFSLILLALLVVLNLQNTRISYNLTTASRFSQNFKSDVDLKLYCYAAGTYTDLPYEEVETAKALANTLLESTGSKESRRAIGTVQNLCENLEKSMDDIQRMDSYDKRMSELETNMYVITELIEKYVYSYLYYEAGQMAILQSQRNTIVTSIVIFVLLTMGLTVFMTFERSKKISRSITQPVDALYARVGDIGRGNLAPQPPIIANDDKLQTLSDSIEKMVLRINTQMQLDQEKQIRIREMELALIQAQINPHFLYNTLDTIVWLIETGKYEAAQDMVGSLSTYFRSFLSNGRDVITLQEELDHVRSYLEIQQVRYKDILSYDFSVDPRFSHCPIPKLTLQPMVENSIYHGIKLKRGGGHISVMVKEDGDRACIEVRDTGAGMTPEQLQALKDSLVGDSRSFGLVSAYRRLELVYGENFRLDIENTKNEGTLIRVLIPANAPEGSPVT